MFGYLGNATIKNLKIENATVKTSGCSGLLANESSGTALKIENCSVSGNVGGIDTGGFIGISNSAFIMRNCYKTGYIDMNEYWSQETYAGADDIIIKNRNTVRLKPELVDCDYYEYLKGNLSAVNTYQGEYMFQYSWAEMTTAVLPVVDKNNK